MLRNDFARFLVPLLAGLLLTGAMIASPQAQENRLFIIPAADGYGISECFDAGADCGRVVADAWCEAHGHGKAEAFGKAEDITASIKAGKDAAAIKLPETAVDAAAIVVKCGE